MLVKLIYLSLVNAFECILDNDCKSVRFSELSDKFCVNNKCMSLKPALSRCNHPQECASYSYYGPLACSAKCGSQSLCGGLLFVKTEYCCKSIPLKGKCNAFRPKVLSGCSKAQSCLTENGISKCSENIENSWFLGTFLSVLGNIVINLGVNFQKLSYSSRGFKFINHNINAFHVGVAVYILGKVLSFSAYIFCNQSILAGLSATGLIANSILAPYINNEKITIYDILAFMTVMFGSSILLYSTGKTHTTYTVCELLQMLRKSENILWLSFIIISIAFLFLIIKFVEINSSRGLSTDRFQFLKSNRVFFEENDKILTYVMIFAYVFMSSFIASFTTLSIKIIGQIVNRYMNEEGKILTFPTIFFTSTLFLCTFFQIYWLNRALMYYDALVVIPIFHMSWTVLSIITAGIYFQDFDSFSKNQFKNFIIGIIIIFCGSIFLGLKIRSKNTLEGREINLHED